jgi:hypothetical protein
MGADKNQSKAKGGKARAASLSPEQRKEIGEKAARARWGTPKADYSGTLKIAETEIPCAVYDNGDRVLRLIVQREVVGLLTGNKKGNLDRYLGAKNLQDFVPKKFKDKSLDQASVVLEIGGRKAHCYEGEDIVDLCKMYLDARKRPGVLLPSQQQLADRAEVLVTSLAKTGITGLIDEATGYQQFRARDALQAYLDRVLRSELAAWVKTFPDEFFFQIYRLKKWPWTGSSRRPQVVGKYIADLVYGRLGPGVLTELEARNPKLPTGKRAAKHFQWLTEDIGNPRLAQHLHALIGFMKANDTWDGFKKMVDRVYPKPDKDNPTLYLPGFGTDQ